MNREIVGDCHFLFGDQKPSRVPEAKWVRLSHGMYTLVDDSDYILVEGYNWAYFRSRTSIITGYAVSGPMLMHRLLLGAGKGQMVDHVDGNGLDNRRHNIRFATKSQNEGNTTKRSNNTSGYKGVFWDKTKNKWLAQLHTKERSIHLGRYLDKDEAARAYDAAARKHFGDFAYTNFSNGGDR